MVFRKSTAKPSAPAAPAAAREERRARAVIDRVIPEVDGGRFAAKAVVGERIDVQAHVFTDGHDVIAVMLRYRHESDADWQETPMKLDVNDEWHGAFTVDRMGRYRYTVTSWVDHFLSWRNDFRRRIDPVDIASAALVGGKLIAETSNRANKTDAQTLRTWGKDLIGAKDTEEIKRIALDEQMAEIAMRYPDRRFASEYRELVMVVDPPRAKFSAWYELFPRSTSPEPGKHGTFRDTEARLAYVAELGFDVLYLPPIHPIGRTKRKGKNNALEAGPDDVGSPWAIGAAEGGHKDIHPQLGTLEDFRSLVNRARELGIEIALDIAFQCAPDHPYVKQHPEWFTWRPDGTVQYAENPPKKYQDIYPFNFESDDVQALWQELKSVFEHWIENGVRIFRVDNPHTKPFPFWEWAITELKAKYPDVLFLAEAFTRPKIMHRLAKLGFSQSYTYFAWRNTKQELMEYLTELAHGPGRTYFRPNVWPNTPDILTEYLQHGGRGAFIARFLLAATAGANYGIYGPAFELAENRPREPGSEEYLDSEKYQLRHWDLDRPDSLRYLISRVNRIRRENPALQDDRTLRFVATDNDQLIAFTKTTADLSNVIMVVVNLDPHHRQSGWVDLDISRLEIDAERSFQVHDLLTDARFLWYGRRNYVELEPGNGHIFAVRRRVRTERDFDYFV